MTPKLDMKKHEGRLGLVPQGEFVNACLIRYEKPV
jgi:hypothetical protein